MQTQLPESTSGTATQSYFDFSEAEFDESYEDCTLTWEYSLASTAPSATCSDCAVTSLLASMLTSDCAYVGGGSGIDIIGIDSAGGEIYFYQADTDSWTILWDDCASRSVIVIDDSISLSCEGLEPDDTSVSVDAYAEFAWAMVEPVEPSAGESCADGFVVDCSGACVDADLAALYTGDGYCDDGSYGYVLTCPEFDDDGGDCG